MNRSGPVVICVEDDSDVNMLISRYLSGNMKIEPVFLENAVEAFDFLALSDPAHSEMADLVIMDYRIPNGIDGISAIRRIRESEAYRDTPIIMITGSEDSRILERAFEAGSNDFLTKPVKKSELLARIKSLLRFGSEMKLRKEREKRLVEMNTKLEEANSRLKEMALFDGLTGIPNRRHFDMVLRAAEKQSRRNRTSLSVIMIDIDHFKLYNDTYGHLQGDECLRKVAQILGKSLMRPADIVSRYGGEEFIAALPETGIHGAEEVAGRIRSAFAAERIVHDKGIGGIVTVSMGIASTDGTEDNVFLVEYADEALYTAKSSGRNTFCFWQKINNAARAGI